MDARDRGDAAFAEGTPGTCGLPLPLAVNEQLPPALLLLKHHVSAKESVLDPQRIGNFLFAYPAWYLSCDA